MDRSSLLVDGPRQDSNESFKWSLVTSFSVQHRQVKSIISKHWNVLKSDRVLSTLLPVQAKVIHRGPPSLRSKIARNIINPPVRASFFHNLIGYYPCKKCGVYHNIRGRHATKEFKSTTTKSLLNILINISVHVLPQMS